MHPEYNGNDFTERAPLELEGYIEYNERMRRMELPNKYFKLHTKDKLNISSYGTLGYLDPSDHKLRNFTAEFISIEECKVLKKQSYKQLTLDLV